MQVAYTVRRDCFRTCSRQNMSTTQPLYVSMNMCLKVLSPQRKRRISSSTVMYNKTVGQESAQKFMKQTGDLKAATLYFAS